MIAAWTLALAAALLWPIRHSGYLLGHDMVFTPRQPLGYDAFGLGTAAPRAVPVDALVALSERILDGAVIGRLAVSLPLIGVGIGAAALLRRQPLAARLAAATFAVWNPYVIERLTLGQWALLWCYAALPWLVITLRRGRGAGRWPARAAALGAASITPTGGLIALVTTIVFASDRRLPARDRIGSTALAVALQLPWLVPSLVSPASATSDPAGVTVFAARAEHPGGALLTLLGGGGIWDADVVPDSRSGVLAWLGLLLLAAAAVTGWTRLRSILGARVFAVLVVLAAAGLLVAWLPTLPGGANLTRGAVAHLPGAGLLRDAQKWVLPLVLLEALVVGAAAARAVERLRTVQWRAVLAVAAAVVPVILLPDAAATLRPTMTPAHYPNDWSRVAQLLEGPGDVAVLPWGSYRRFPWVASNSVLDPAPRLLPRPTVVDDRISVGGHPLRGENRRAVRVGRALDSGSQLPARLAGEGVGWVLVERNTPGAVPNVAGLTPVFLGRSLSLYRVPLAAAGGRPAGGRLAAVASGDGLAVTAILSCLLVGPIRTRRRRKARPGSGPSLL